MKFHVVLKQFRLNILVHRVRFVWSKDITAILFVAYKDFNSGMHLQVYKPICFKLCTTVAVIELFFFFCSSLSDLDLCSRLNGSEKAKKKRHRLSKKKFTICLADFGKLFRFLDLYTHFISSDHLSRDIPLLRKEFALACIQKFPDCFLFAT